MTDRHLRSWSPRYGMLLVVTGVASGGLRSPATGTAQQPAPQPATQTAPTKPAAALAFADVTVIDVTDGRLLPHQTVVIAGNRVRAVGKAGEVAVPRGAQVMDARGKYLIPGLWDMHVHVDGNSSVYPLYIARGVTGVREMAQRTQFGPDSFRVWQREIAAGTRVGPRGVGPSADVTPGLVTVTTPDQARHAVDSLKAAGTNFIKMHDRNMARDVYFALLAEGRRVGAPVVGHTPLAVTEIEVADSGQRSIEHIVDPLADIQNAEKIQAVVANGRYFNRAALDALITTDQSAAPQ